MFTKKEKKSKNFTIRIEASTINRLEELAEKNNLSVAEVIRQILNSVIKSPHEDKLPIR